MPPKTHTLIHMKPVINFQDNYMIQRIRKYIFITGFITISTLLQQGCQKENFDSYNQETGQLAIHNRALASRANLNILSIAIEPGFEDLETLSSFRLGQGAKITSAYVTNGETGENDQRWQYPHELAATRRSEADNAISLLGGEAYFLNMPDIAAIQESAHLRKVWPSQTMQAKLKTLILKARPDIILLAYDKRMPDNSTRSSALQEDVISAAKALSHPTDSSTVYWRVSRIVKEVQGKTGLSVDIDKKHPVIGKSYVETARTLRAAYKSLAGQLPLWENYSAGRYTCIFPSTDTNIKTIDEGLPPAITPRFQKTGEKIARFTQRVIDGDDNDALHTIAELLRDISIHFGVEKNMTAHETRTLISWSSGLENLRCALLGIEAEFTLENPVLTNRQVTMLSIDKLAGLPEGGQTTVSFMNMDGWAVNESKRKTFPLELNAKYRILSAQELSYNFPQHLYGSKSNRIHEPIFLFISHKAAKKENSFNYRLQVNILRAPKMHAEVLTPIIPMVSGVKVDVKLTNHSNDGIADSIALNHRFGASAPVFFRINKKDQSQTVSLYPVWKDKEKATDFILPLEISGDPIGNVAVRAFDARVKEKKRIGVIEGAANSPLLNALQNLYCKYESISTDTPPASLDSFDVILVDRRAMTLNPFLKGNHSALTSFARNGGHIIIFSQDAEIWNSAPLLAHLTLKQTSTYSKDSRMHLAGNHAVLQTPYELNPTDWQGWEGLRAFNELTFQEQKGVEILIKGAGDLPLLLMQEAGSGHMTYVDLALHPQWQNVHAGAYRLLANLISY